MSIKIEEDDVRHPFTYSADFVRALAPIGPSGVVLSRADASAIINGIAQAMRISHEELALILSEAQQQKTDADHEKEAKRFIRAVGLA